MRYPTLPTPPPFPAYDPAASFTEQGRSALLYLMQHSTAASCHLDTATLEAACHACSLAQTAREISDVTLRALTGLQDALRGLLKARAARAATLAADFSRLFEAAMLETPEAALAAADAPADVPPAAVAVPDVPAPANYMPPVTVIPAAATVAAPAAVPTGYRAMSARFPGKCLVCGGYIDRNDPIWFAKGIGCLHARDACRPQTPPAPPSNGGGGSKVPRKPYPVGPSSPGALQAPVQAPQTPLQAFAGARQASAPVAIPGPVAAPVAVPALPAAGDWF